MADSNLRRAPRLRVAAAIALGLTLAAPAMPAVAPAKSEIIALDAQSSELDLKSNNMFFRKVRIAQGSMSVTADQGQATQEALKFENSLWVFRGNVKITMEGGLLTADEAQIDFVKKLLSKAVAHGKPAEFEQKIEKTGKIAHGHADTIDYDAAKGVVKLTTNAWLSDGQNEVHGESLKYNVLAQSIVADAAEQGSQRVHIIITPPPSKP
ncbi:MAG: lipopolysaccharide transport periplasmic protein LptA [Steroidobacteraceae bacterium]|jgi:lipopolysaccharide transport protein LptA